ncbi:hypothetical protein IQ268_28060 [Oculatella sp. LEGE 06141]|uniref:hypothetical protein n=1 Tax=Oculatella sp. LEGE 06141 TaxID=1828648 RepID=UPI0018830C57|nr:hypothetical protein [Oculatella sp. LEGE 06141]MBE9182407.1 hypothetical protein [Oculatella sp. LEGE 06141]
MKYLMQSAVRVLAVAIGLTAPFLNVIPAEVEYRYPSPPIYERLNGLMIQLALPWSLIGATSALALADVGIRAAATKKDESTLMRLQMRLRDRDLSPELADSYTQVLGDLLADQKEENHG